MAQWDAAYVNNLPDSSFLYVAPGGEKDSEGKTKPRSLRYFPVKDAGGNVDLPHLRNALARIPQSSLGADVKASATKKAQGMLQAAGGGRSQEEFRALPEQGELREGNTLVGHLAVFDQWAEINSRMEGHFMERMAPGAFDKTISESRQRMRVLFNHGADPTFHDKPLGPISVLEPDEYGLRYEVPLLDTSYNRDLIEMLKAEPPVLGSSFRFEVMQEHRERNPGRSEHNPKGIQERTIKEVRMREFGPTPFPAYEGAGAGLRSLTDRMLLGEARVDYEDMGCLAQMIQLGSAYIGEQDEPEDEQNIPKMQAVLASLIQLQQYELEEEEPADEPDDEAEMASADARSADAPRAAGAGYSTPSRAGRAITLYTGREEAQPAWKL